MTVPLRSALNAGSPMAGSGRLSREVSEGLLAMHSVSKRQMDMIGLVTCLAVTGLVVYFGLMPAYRAREAMITEKELLQNKKKLAMDSALRLSQLKQEYSSVEREVSSHPLQLKPLNYLNQRISDITRLAVSDGLEMDQIEPGTSRRDDFYITVPLRMAGRGEFEEAVAFLHRLHESVPDMAVGKVSLTARPGASKAVADFHLDLVWHAAPQDE